MSLAMRTGTLATSSISRATGRADGVAQVLPHRYGQLLLLSIDSSPFCSDYGSGDAGARPEGLYDIASSGSPHFGLAFRDITNGATMTWRRATPVTCIRQRLAMTWRADSGLPLSPIPRKLRPQTGRADLF